MSALPESHPRYASLKIREMIVAGVERGITSVDGLIAHGRGEAFDYLIGETTQRFAQQAVRAAAARLILAAHPVISVNGNAAALVPDSLVALSKALTAPLEVNIFHTSSERERVIRQHLLEHGAHEVLLPTMEAELPGIESNRRFVHPDGLLRADVVFVPLEDGDRCEALRRIGKDVITVDLNPMSRTARAANITIVDNIVRAAPLLLAEVAEQQRSAAVALEAIVSDYQNDAALREAVDRIRTGE